MRFRHEIKDYLNITEATHNVAGLIISYTLTAIYDIEVVSEKYSSFGNTTRLREDIRVKWEIPEMALPEDLIVALFCRLPKGSYYYSGLAGEMNFTVDIELHNRKLVWQSSIDSVCWIDYTFNIERYGVYYKSPSIEAIPWSRGWYFELWIDPSHPDFRKEGEVPVIWFTGERTSWGEIRKPMKMVDQGGYQFQGTTREVLVGRAEDRANNFTFVYDRESGMLLTWTRQLKPYIIGTKTVRPGPFSETMTLESTDLISLPTELMLASIPSLISDGDMLRIQGTLSAPSADASVILIASRVGQTPEKITIKTSRHHDRATFLYYWKPRVGNWTLKVVFMGSEMHLPAESASYAVSVYPKAKDLLSKATELRSRALSSSFVSEEGRYLLRKALDRYDSAQAAYAEEYYSHAEIYAQEAIDLFEEALSRQTIEKALQEQLLQRQIISYALAGCIVVVVAGVLFYFVRKRRVARQPDSAGSLRTQKGHESKL